MVLYLSIFSGTYKIIRIYKINNWIIDKFNFFSNLFIYINLISNNTIYLIFETTIFDNFPGMFHLSAGLWGGGGFLTHLTFQQVNNSITKKILTGRGGGSYK